MGGQAQRPFIRKVSSSLRLDIAHYRELEVFAQFGSSLGDSTKAVLDSGAKTVEALKQNEGEPMSFLKEAVSLYAVSNGFLKEIPLRCVGAFLRELYDHFEEKQPALLRSLSDRGALDHREEIRFNEVIEAFVKEFTERHAEQ